MPCRALFAVTILLAAATGCDQDSGDSAPQPNLDGSLGDGFVFTDSGARDGGTDMARDAGRRDGGAQDAGDPGVCGTKDFCDDGLDNDCDGTVDEDCPCVPGETQRCYDGHPSEAGRGVCTYGMQTCSGGTGDEFGFWGSCEGSSGPQPVECGGMRDWHCNGLIDEGCPCADGDTRDCYTGPSGTEGVGLCHGGTQTCEAMGDTAAFGACVGEVLPARDPCDGTDADCDGVPDTGCACRIGDARACYTGPAGTEGVGLCRAGMQECLASAGVGAAWGPCEGEVLPAPDACDGLDHACSGTPGLGCECVAGEMRSCYGGAAGTAGVGPCRAGTQTCAASGGGPPSWPASCVGQVLPVTEICVNGIDDDCDGAVDEGCYPEIVCPPDVTVPAGQSTGPMTVTGPDLVTFSWAVVDGPPGGAATAVWSPTPPAARTEAMVPTIVGAYRVRVTGADAAGAAASCELTVTALPHGLRVELTWDGPGDVDLHLHSNRTGFAWFTPDDCFWSSPLSSFAATLDFDNVVGLGPENIRVDSPAAGDTFHVGVHNYLGAEGRIATVRIYCGDTSTSPAATYTSRPLLGTARSDMGNCTMNDFWRVATVAFTSPSTCRVTPLDEYVTASDACMRFDP